MWISEEKRQAKPNLGQALVRLRDQGRKEIIRLGPLGELLHKPSPFVFELNEGDYCWTAPNFTDRPDGAFFSNAIEWGTVLVLARHQGRVWYAYLNSDHVFQTWPDISPNYTMYDLFVRPELWQGGSNPPELRYPFQGFRTWNPAVSCLTFGGGRYLAGQAKSNLEVPYEVQVKRSAPLHESNSLEVMGSFNIAFGDIGDQSGFSHYPLHYRPYLLPDGDGVVLELPEDERPQPGESLLEAGQPGVERVEPIVVYELPS